MSKTRSAVNLETTGYCHYKYTDRIKRHLSANVSGNAYFVKCTSANSSDNAELPEIIKEHNELLQTGSIQSTEH